MVIKLKENWDGNRRKKKLVDSSIGSLLIDREGRRGNSIKNLRELKNV
jgi:hypothetical protein